MTWFMLVVAFDFTHPIAGEIIFFLVKSGHTRSASVTFKPHVAEWP